MNLFIVGINNFQGGYFAISFIMEGAYFDAIVVYFLNKKYWSIDRLQHLCLTGQFDHMFIVLKEIFEIIFFLKPDWFYYEKG